jgi:hypothetical protein
VCVLYKFRKIFFCRAFRRTRGAADSESDYEEDYLSSRRPAAAKLSNRNPPSAEFRGRAKKKPDYRDDVSDHDSSSDQVPSSLSKNANFCENVFKIIAYYYDFKNIFAEKSGEKLTFLLKLQLVFAKI